MFKKSIVTPACEKKSLFFVYNKVTFPKSIIVRIHAHDKLQTIRPTIYDQVVFPVLIKFKHKL
jgi:hypothetical protein